MYKLQKIEIDKMFGYLEYEIPKLDESVVTFIIAKNGMGKTTILRMLYGLSNNDYDVFRLTEYKDLKFTFCNGTSSNIINFYKTEKGEPRWKIIMDGVEGVEHELPKGFNALRTANEKVEWLEKHTEIVDKASCGKHWTVNGKGHFDANEVLEELEEYVKTELSTKGATLNIEFLDEWKVSFISANRLISYENKKPQEVVNIISGELSKSMTIHEVETVSFTKTFEHDFLQKLLNSSRNNAPTIDELKLRLDAINISEKKVQKYGLYPEVDPIEIPKDLDTEQLKTLNTFLDDKAARLNPHLEFLKRLELFEELVNLSLAMKEIIPDKHEGIIVRRKGNVRLKLDQLSSGEQHLIIIAYKLVFGIPEHSYVLVDEPELSMHLEWQSAFATMLEKVSEIRELRFLCATHSPSIVDSRIAEVRDIKMNFDE